MTQDRSTVYVAKDQHRALKALAALKATSVETLVAEAIELAYGPALASLRAANPNGDEA
jgi:hypothetical protein